MKAPKLQDADGQDTYSSLLSSVSLVVLSAHLVPIDVSWVAFRIW